MAIVVPDCGACELLDKLLKDALSTDESFVLKLYSNNYTCISSSTAANFTEATFTNYSAKTLTRAGWGSAAIVDGAAKSIYSVEQSWTCGATGQTIYGYYLIGATSGTLLWADKFSTARTLAENGVLEMTPTFGLRSDT